MARPYLDQVEHSTANGQHCNFNQDMLHKIRPEGGASGDSWFDRRSESKSSRKMGRVQTER